MSQWEEHENFVTETVRRWFETEHKAEIERLLTAIRMEDERAVRDDPEVVADHEQNKIWLAGELDQWAQRHITLPLPSGVTRSLVMDALSEVDWDALADTFYPA